MKRYILVTMGTSGDVNPFVGLGRALKERGHKVVIITNPYFEKFILDAGLEFLPIGTKEEYIEGINNPDLWNTVKSSAIILNSVILPNIKKVYEIIENLCRNGDNIIVSSSMALGARIAQEKLGIPLCTTYYTQPSLRSDREALGFTFPDWIPSPLTRSIFALTDRLFIDRAICGKLNEVRAELGLGPVKIGTLSKWINSPQVVLCLYPEWLKPFQPGWPKNTIQTGFTYYDGAIDYKQCESVMQFIESEEPPIVFTPGTGVVNEANFFKVAVESVQALKKRALLCTKYSSQVPEKLPDSVMYTDYVPFNLVLKKTALIVHHGGMGTMVQAMSAAIPQIIRPMAHDQLQNGNLAQKLGVGTVIKRDKFTVNNVTEKLHYLLTSETVAGKCREIAGKFDNFGYKEKTCDILEKL
ncbi:MAG TPA: glycosyltransferase [Ruminiclostridium sp.]|nr:glycosyltransferase [Ruminiclostridium sp.]